jgi:hypothetical protein
LHSLIRIIPFPLSLQEFCCRAQEDIHFRFPLYCVLPSHNMKTTTLALLPVIAGVGSALPVGLSKRQQNLDLDILQFALTVSKVDDVSEHY